MFASAVTEKPPDSGLQTACRRPADGLLSSAVRPSAPLAVQRKMKMNVETHKQKGVVVYALPGREQPVTFLLEVVITRSLWAGGSPMPALPSFCPLYCLFSTLFL